MPATLKLSDNLKRRIARLAKKEDKSPHAFMIEAIERTTQDAEKYDAFVEDALRARVRFEKDGLAYDAKEVHRYWRDKLAGKRVRHPSPKVVR